MNTIVTSAMTLLFFLSAAAYAQVPATNGKSDPNGNTGIGSGALGGPAASNGGLDNTAAGGYALYSNTTGSYNTAAGSNALYSNSTGDYNTAAGLGALYSNTTGNANTAAGINALQYNDNGSNNTASGANAFAFNTSGSNNTATGANALEGALFASTGDYNTATGSSALQSNTTGYSNTAAGFQALLSNTGGYSNTASGVNALYSNTAGIDNTASGQDALFSNSTGNDNTATGVQALNSATGSGNIAVGFQAGLNVTTGSSNIEIGNVGAAADNKVIKIGTVGTHKKAYIAGIFSNAAVSGLTVVVGSNGELGAVSSSERFKTDIAPMGSNTAKLQQLRPVIFHYKADPRGTLRYGLIAEEVAKVYPELVVRNGEGRIDGVRYDELAPMLLNEMQKQQAKLAEVDELKQQIAELRNQNAAMQGALLMLQGKGRLVAQR
jgi:hypothetical protein